MDNWRRMAAAEQGRALARGEIDARDLTESYLAAIEAHPDRDRIYVRAMPERARAEAAAAHARLSEGRRAGPLDGVPISWKDLYDTAGIATEGGSRLLAGRVPDKDALVLTRATAAGTVCLGKTHTTELAFSGLGINPKTATPPNAIDPPRAPGGSSSGAAVSTKLGLAAAGIGSDTGGSVRVPSAWNDLVGLKTTAGRIPTDGVIALSPIYDTVGPLCHTVEDAALLYGILADLPAPDIGDGDPSGIRLSVAEGFAMSDLEAEVADGFEAAMVRLSQAGMTIGRGDVPEFAGAVDVMSTITPVVTADAWNTWGETINANPGVMFDRIETRFRQGDGVDPALVEQALAGYERHRDALVARIAETGPVILPTSPILPPDAARLLSDEDYFTSKNLMALRNTRLANLLPMSAITLPSGTPMVGLMVVAAPGEEATLLRIGRAIERALALG